MMKVSSIIIVVGFVSEKHRETGKMLNAVKHYISMADIETRKFEQLWRGKVNDKRLAENSNQTFKRTGVLLKTRTKILLYFFKTKIHLLRKQLLLWRHDIQHNDTQHRKKGRETQHLVYLCWVSCYFNVMLRVVTRASTMLLIIVTQSVVMLNVIMLSVGRTFCSWFFPVSDCR